jgi:uncharacterized protein YdaT
MEDTMEESSGKVYAEVYEILNLIEDDFYYKIPKKVLNFFRDERDIEYTPIIDINKSLDEQGLSERTITILSILNINYWCENEEKEEFINLLDENEEYEYKLTHDKYNPDNLFKKNNDKSVSENTELVIYNEKSIINKILEKIKTLFKRNGVNNGK